MRRVAVAVGSVILVVVAGCGAGDDGPVKSSDGPDASTGGRYRGTYDELPAIQDEIDDSGGSEGSGIENWGAVEVRVYVDDGVQEAYDERYGEGTIVVTALLQPVD